MSILYKNYRYFYFNGDLLLHIQNGKNDKVRSILRDVADCHLIAGTSGATLLHFAAKYGNTEISQYLIDLGARVDAENQIKETPLMYAVEANQLSTVRTLLEANADVLKHDGAYGISVIWKVIRHRDNREQKFKPEICKDAEQKIHEEIRENIMMAVLSKVTSSQSFTNINQAFHLECPLYYFIELENAEVTRTLLEKGHPVNAKKPRTGETALHEAAKRLNLENVKVLLEYNADVNAYDEHGKTPLASIESFDHQQKTLTVVKALIAAGAMLIDDNRHIILAQSILQNGNGEMIETLLQYPIDLRFSNRIGATTPLHYLAMNKNANILEKLRDLRADVFEKSKKGLLCIVAKECNIDAVKYLLDCGADVNAKDRHNDTVLRIVVREGVKVQLNVPLNENVPNEYLDCIELLLERGADPQKFDINDNVILPGNEQFGDRITPAIEPIFAHLSLLEVSGQAINQHTQNEIQSSVIIRNVFQDNKQHFEEMKTIRIDELVTLFDFLTANEQRILLYTRNKVLISNLTNAIKVWNFNSYSGRMLNKRFLKFSRLVDWKEKFVALMNEVLSELCDLHIKNVAEKIVEYLVHEKWKEIAQVCA